eukprot:764148-Hanusia_phi.AAC.7
MSWRRGECGEQGWREAELARAEEELLFSSSSAGQQRSRGLSLEFRLELLDVHFIHSLPSTPRLLLVCPLPSLSPFHPLAASQLHSFLFKRLLFAPACVSVPSASPLVSLSYSGSHLCRLDAAAACRYCKPRPRSRP